MSWRFKALRKKSYDKEKEYFPNFQILFKFNFFYIGQIYIENTSFQRHKWLHKNVNNFWHCFLVENFTLLPFWRHQPPTLFLPTCSPQRLPQPLQQPPCSPPQQQWPQLLMVTPHWAQAKPGIYTKIKVLRPSFLVKKLQISYVICVKEFPEIIA